MIAKNRCFCTSISLFFLLLFALSLLIASPFSSSSAIISKQNKKKIGNSANKNHETTKTFWPFQDPAHDDFGLVEEASGRPCLLARFTLRLHNLNLNNTDLAVETVSLLESGGARAVHLSGFCALPNEVRRQAQLRAQWQTSDSGVERRLELVLDFAERFVPSSSGASAAIAQHADDELRWALSRVQYTESVGDRSMAHFQTSFSAAKDTTPSQSAPISAPLNQKFVCSDPVNVTLRNEGGRFAPVLVEFLPPIDLQPMNGAGQGFGSNVYTCERTRRRTLREAFQSRMTVGASVALGAASVGTIIGYSVWRHLKTTDSAAGTGDFYGSF